jgi:hypothetical protein
LIAPLLPTASLYQLSNLVVAIQEHPEIVVHILVKKFQARARGLHVQNLAHHADRRVVPQRKEF